MAILRLNGYSTTYIIRNLRHPSLRNYSPTLFLSLKALSCESHAVVEESYELSGALFNRKLQIMNIIHRTSKNVEDLSDLDALFVGCLNNTLDRLLRDARCLAEQAKTLQSM